jgi:hypothetical protein
MNILTAPLELVAPWMRNIGLTIDAKYQIPDDDGAPAPEPPPPDPIYGFFLFFLRSATLLCLLVLVAGGYFIADGKAGQITLKGMGIQLDAGTAGLSLVGIALAFYLLIGYLIVKMRKP